MATPKRLFALLLLFPVCFCFNNPATTIPSPFKGSWEHIDSLQGITYRLEIDTPFVIGILKWETPNCSLCPSTTFEIDGIWYNDARFFNYITWDSDTVIMEYRFNENGDTLLLHGVSSGLTRVYLMFDSLLLVKRNDFPDVMSTRHTITVP